MRFQLESLPFQEAAIRAVVNVFDGTETNTFDNATFEGIRANVCRISEKQFIGNIKSVVNENGIEEETAKISKDRDICIEMETGTGKTLVYIKSIYELYKNYGFSKFIILVPSIAIREGTIKAFEIFKSQLEDIYGFAPQVFEYDSKRLNKVINFIEEQHPQVMVMTLASFNSEDRILNQAQREDLFANIPFIEAIAKTNPIIIMDEPQEGMDTDNSIGQIAKLKPLAKLRYSATHKVVKNLVYRLTPFDSYKQGLVKRIEVLSVTEKNDEASLKIEFSNIQNGKGEPKAKLKAWILKSDKYVFAETNWLKVGDNLGEKTKNPSYLNYGITRINKSLKTGKWTVTFSNGISLEERRFDKTIQESIWAIQLEWLIHRHFEKTIKFSPHGIKCLSLIFIDRVANYTGDYPIIKKLFVAKYKQKYAEFHDGKLPSDEEIAQIQGSYFAQKATGEFSDTEGGQAQQKSIYDLILKKKEELLDLSNPVQFIFSHSALGVGWDNPNVFNIATLNSAYSDIRKRQEIGRGLRICVNQLGQRIYDPPEVDDEKRINQLTIIPNETYETFARQYQEEIKEVYGTAEAGAGLTHSHKGKPQNEVKFTRSRNESIDAAFRRFWKALAKKTDFTVAFDEESLVGKAAEEINKIVVPAYEAEVKGVMITDITADGIENEYRGADQYALKGNFAPLDLVEELSENTGLSYTTLFMIVKRLTNYEQLVKNPPQYIHRAAQIIRNIELDEMIRGLDYRLSGETFPFNFEDYVVNIPDNKYVETPNRGLFDKIKIDSTLEGTFAKYADNDDEIVCFLKLPPYYKIPTPIGEYEPDFGLVMKRKKLDADNESEFYFVVEIKGTNDINNKKALRESEIYKIKCAMKHFRTLGVEVHYKAPIKEYEVFKSSAAQTIQALTR